MTHKDLHRRERLGIEVVFRESPSSPHGLVSGMWVMSDHSPAFISKGTWIPARPWVTHYLCLLYACASGLGGPQSAVVHRAGSIDSVVHYGYNLLTMDLTVAGTHQLKMWISVQTEVQLNPDSDLCLLNIEKNRILEKE